MNRNIQTKAVEVFLDKGNAANTETIDLPDGEITHIGLVKDGTTTEIINLEVLQNNSRLLDPIDIRFSERTGAGTFLESLRPVSGITGGRTLQVRLSALNSTRTDDLTVQVVFVIQPVETY
jgi:hypothetical protein